MTDRACCAPKLSTTSRDPIASPSDRTTLNSTGPRNLRGQVLVQGGTFFMGDAFDEGYPSDGEGPVHEVSLPSFYIDATTVTNSQFSTFVKATGYVTDAEQLGVAPVFHLAFRGRRADILHEVAETPWWLAVRGASWRFPEGPGSEVGSRANHPVVQVSWGDALSYCSWAGKRLPTEAEWEYAARGGLTQARYVWGDELTPRSRRQCNIWNGTFPSHNTLEDGHLTTAPVKSYTPNGFGLWQMAGNVWEWCQDWFDADYYTTAPSHAPKGPIQGTHKTIRGGSYLCHASYCHRYRVSARSSNTPDSATANMGFRCANDYVPDRTVRLQ
ncbi:formylglycine-generating enzyme family protein [Rhodococcus fascians]|nr:formylglycine-generating enzyme family protein [Rhodococcus fascians]